ncbi:MAG: hypothetical protein ACPG77_17940 [Nannocystaceae bacterium]
MERDDLLRAEEEVFATYGELSDLGFDEPTKFDRAIEVHCQIAGDLVGLKTAIRALRTFALSRQTQGLLSPLQLDDCYRSIFTFESACLDLLQAPDCRLDSGPYLQPLPDETFPLVVGEAPAADEAALMMLFDRLLDRLNSLAPPAGPIGDFPLNLYKLPNGTLGPYTPYQFKTHAEALRRRERTAYVACLRALGRMQQEVLGFLKTVVSLTLQESKSKNPPFSTLPQ